MGNYRKRGLCLKHSNSNHVMSNKIDNKPMSSISEIWNNSIISAVHQLKWWTHKSINYEHSKQSPSTEKDISELNSRDTTNSTAVKVWKKLENKT